MRAMDCSDPGTHEDIHFGAKDDDELFGQIKQPRDQALSVQIIESKT